MTTDNKTLPVFRFARYVNGVRMAEGVTIEKANNLTDAMRTAAKLATIGHGGDVPVLVHEPATLADVQPGGRVRLGDQADLDRLEFQAWARELLPCPFCGNSAEFVPYKDNGLTLKCKSMGCIQRNQRTLRYGIDWLRTSMAEHWNTRALSAQPSPGGQGEVTDDMVKAALGPNGWSTYNEEWSSRDRMRAALAAGLAARQPVGEPVARSIIEEFVQCADVGRLPGKLLAQARDYLAAPPAQQADQEYLESLDRALEGVIDERDRYHEMADDLAGHIAAITGVDIGEHSSANRPWQNAIEAAEEYQPAQAVDLGQFRALAEFGEEFSFSAEKQPQSRVIYAQARRLLALIDKAVGNGN